jgi:hypothetical protein
VLVLRLSPRRQVVLERIHIRREIFLKTMSRYRSRNRESRCRLAFAIEVSHVVVRTLFVSSSVGNIVRQRPTVPASISELRRDSSTVKM